MSQGLLGLCCLIETRDRIEGITLTAVLFELPLGHLLHRFPATDVNTSKISHALDLASYLMEIEHIHNSKATFCCQILTQFDGKLNSTFRGDMPPLS